MRFVWEIVVIVIGAAIVLTGSLVGFIAFPNIIDDQITQSVPLVEGTDAWERWETLPLPVVYKIYFFNVSNPDEVQNGAQPIVTEIGPYVYKSKINITREDDILSYYQHHHFEFDEAASSPLTEYDEITIVNVPLMSVVTGAEYVATSSLQMIALNIGIPTLFSGPTSVFRTTTPRDFLFDGEYIMCNTTNIVHGPICENIEAQPAVTMPRLEDGRFRFTLLGHKNDTHDGYYSINSGTIDVSQLGEIVAWENSGTLDTWPDNSTCNKIVGSDASLFPPFATEESSFNIFSTDICRSVGVNFAKDTEFSGINGLRYVPDNNVFASPSNNSENECFCLNRTQGIRGDDGCLLDGTLELWDCVGGPLVASLPHFYQASDEYQTGVQGISPDESLHRMFLDLEPMTGTLLRGSKRMQFNIFLRPINLIALTTNLPTVLMPIVWIDEGIELTDELIDTLNDELFSTITLLLWITWGSIAVGALIILIGFVWLITSIMKSRKVY